ncbi:MAG: GNAT family N-acetyltransferase [Kouleothrix sp.]|nr:GNAT family N-acetyltransferase [Kouleothrix sp.]
MTISLRALTEADLELADAIQSEAYGVGGRRELMQMYLRLQPGGWLLASLDGEPAGLAGATDFGALAYVGLVSVRPALQRRGVALAMMRHLLAWLRGRGCPSVVLDASAAGAPLYDRLGFVEDEQTHIFRQGDCAPQPYAAERVRQIGAADLPALAAFDAPIFGADRAALLAELLAANPGRALLAHDADGAIAGYLFAQGQVIGPWAARAPADAEELLRAGLALGFEGPPRVVAPGSNPAAAAMLMRYGFSPWRSLSHMRLGGDRPPGNRALYYGQATLAIG